MEDMGDGREDSLVLSDDGEGYLELNLQLQWSGSGVDWNSLGELTHSSPI